MTTVPHSSVLVSWIHIRSKQSSATGGPFMRTVGCRLQNRQLHAQGRGQLCAGCLLRKMAGYFSLPLKIPQHGNVGGTAPHSSTIALLSLHTTTRLRPRGFLPSPGPRGFEHSSDIHRTRQGAAKSTRTLCRSISWQHHEADGVRVVADRFGGPGVLRVEQQSPPSDPRPHEVVLKVSAAGVNPADTYIREGKYKYLPSDFPFTPGIEGAGTVVAIGAGLEGFEPGDSCLFFGHNGQHTGSHATYCTADSAVCHRLPPEMDLELAAAGAVAYWTAFRALHQNMLRPAGQGDTVFIHGGSGAVGLACLQTAKALGVETVICSTGSSLGEALLYAQGASLVVDHRHEGHMKAVMKATSGRGVDVVVEMLANANLGEDIKILAEHGRVAVVGSRGTVNVDPRDLMLCEGFVHGVYLWSATRDEREDALAFLIKGIESGALQPNVGRRYPLAQAAEAHEEVISRSAKTNGKIILIP